MQGVLEMYWPGQHGVGTQSSTQEDLAWLWQCCGSLAGLPAVPLHCINCDSLISSQTVAQACGRTQAVHGGLVVKLQRISGSVC